MDSGYGEAEDVRRCLARLQLEREGGWERAHFKPWRLMRYTDVRLEEDPPYPLKKVPEEAIHQIEMRKEASWKRLPGAFSGGEWGALPCGTVLLIVVCRPWGLVFVPTGPTILLCYY